jgi:predicted RNA binding protein YcfA (HicA-like mRNA interferase family)
MSTLKPIALAAALLLGAMPLALAASNSSDAQHATSGTSSMPKLTAHDVQTKLENNGYTQVGDIKPSKDGWTARAWKGDHPYLLDIDNSGKIKKELRAGANK